MNLDERGRRAAGRSAAPSARRGRSGPGRRSARAVRRTRRARRNAQRTASSGVLALAIFVGAMVFSSALTPADDRAPATGPLPPGTIL